MNKSSESIRTINKAIISAKHLLNGGIYSSTDSILTDKQQRFCRCVLHVAKNNSKKCNRNKSWGDNKCYNPYSVCASSTGTTTGSKPCNYVFTKPNSTVPYEEIIAYALLNYDKINKWSPMIHLDSILDDEDLLRVHINKWYMSKKR